MSKTCGEDVVTLIDASLADISSKIQYECYSIDFIVDSVLQEKLQVFGLILD